MTSSWSYFPPLLSSSFEKNYHGFWVESFESVSLRLWVELRFWVESFVRVCEFKTLVTPQMPKVLILCKWKQNQAFYLLLYYGTPVKTICLFFYYIVVQGQILGILGVVFFVAFSLENPRERGY